MNKNTKNMFVWFILGLVVIVAIYQLINRSDHVHQLATSDFHNYVNEEFLHVNDDIPNNELDYFEGYLVIDNESIKGKFRELYIESIIENLDKKDIILTKKWKGDFKTSRDTNDDYKPAKKT